ncbi:MAG: hypothetical protein ACTS73_05305 [Arsenophonus sp. NEOnobi-MAG3]
MDEILKEFNAECIGRFLSRSSIKSPSFSKMEVNATKPLPASMKLVSIV